MVITSVRPGWTLSTLFQPSFIPSVLTTHIKGRTLLPWNCLTWVSVVHRHAYILKACDSQASITEQRCSDSWKPPLISASCILPAHPHPQWWVTLYCSGPLSSSSDSYRTITNQGTQESKRQVSTAHIPKGSVLVNVSSTQLISLQKLCKGRFSRSRVREVTAFMLNRAPCTEQCTHTDQEMISVFRSSECHHSSRSKTGVAFKLFAHHLKAGQQRSQAKNPTLSFWGHTTSPGKPHREAAASRLTNSQVGVDRGITGCASQVLVFPIRDVLVGPGIPVLLGQTKINDVY